MLGPLNGDLPCSPVQRTGNPALNLDGPSAKMIKQCPKSSRFLASHTLHTLIINYIHLPHMSVYFGPLASIPSCMKSAEGSISLLDNIVCHFGGRARQYPLAAGPCFQVFRSLGLAMSSWCLEGNLHIVYSDHVVHSSDQLGRAFCLFSQYAMLHMYKRTIRMCINT